MRITMRSFCGAIRQSMALRSKEEQEEASLAAEKARQREEQHGAIRSELARRKQEQEAAEERRLAERKALDERVAQGVSDFMARIEQERSDFIAEQTARYQQASGRNQGDTK